MTSPALFRELFSEAPAVGGESLSAWFDARTASFGGRGVLETVRDLVGHCSRFDFREAAPQIPRVDLPHLKPFFVAMLELNHRKVQPEDETLTFKTPVSWASEPGVRSRYENMVFDRHAPGPNALGRVLGVGHRLLEKALGQARDQTICVAALPSDLLPSPLLVFRITDRSTEEKATLTATVAGVEGWPGENCSVLRDWELLMRLNAFVGGRTARRWRPLAPPTDRAPVLSRQSEALVHLQRQLAELAPLFRVPQAHLLATFWPVPPLAPSPGEEARP
jgi:hypothetical protein